VSERPDLDALPAIPRDREGPVFVEPWEAQAFALAVRLHERGCFTWREWTDALAAEISLTDRSGATVKTIYLGGGTPSLLTAAEIDRLIEAIDATRAFFQRPTRAAV